MHLALACLQLARRACLRLPSPRQQGAETSGWGSRLRAERAAPQVVLEMIEVRDVDTARAMLRQTRVFTGMRQEDPDRFQRLDTLCGRTYFDIRCVCLRKWAPCLRWCRPECLNLREKASGPDRGAGTSIARWLRTGRPLGCTLDPRNTTAGRVGATVQRGADATRIFRSLAGLSVHTVWLTTRLLLATGDVSGGGGGAERCTERVSGGI